MTIRLLLLALAFSATAFSTQAQKRYSLEGKKITTLDMRSDKTGSVKPGDVLQTGVVANLAKGDALLTEGFLQGKTTWDNYHLRVTGGEFQNGVLTVSTNAQAFDNHRVLVTVYNALDSTKSARLGWSVDYDQDYTLDFSGKNGADG